MSDPRLTPSNGRVAHIALQGQVTASRFVAGEWRGVRASVADLCRTPGGPRDRQLLAGERFLLLEERDGHAFGQAEVDGYVGYVTAQALGPDMTPTHRVMALASHVYARDDFKSADLRWLSHGAQLAVTEVTGRFAALAGGGHVPVQHLAPLDQPAKDPAGVAQMFLGTPYLWGGNSAKGIDCSGLVQRAFLSCGLPCPRDSDQQQAGLGRELAPDEPPQRGDLLFWKGHVGMLLDAETLLHANAHHMQVASEPVDQAIARIAKAEFGGLLCRRRMDGPR